MPATVFSKPLDSQVSTNVTDIAALSARVDQLDPEMQTALFTDVPFSIPANAWTAGTGIWTYTWQNALILANSGIHVIYDNSFRPALAGDIYITQAVGSITFITTGAPAGTLTGTIRIISSTSGITTVAQGGTGAGTPKQARQNLNVSIKAIPVNFGTVSSLPQSVFDADITSDMVPRDWVYGNPAACPQGLTCTTANGSVTISLPQDGTFSGETTVRFYLESPRGSVEGAETVQETQHISDFVQVSQQSLSAAQKAQARTNIGAADGSVIGNVPSGKTLQGQVDTLEGKQVEKVVGTINWVSSFTAQLAKGQMYLFVSQRYGDLIIVICFADGAVGARVLYGSNWTLTGSDETLTGAATSPADYSLVRIV